MAKFVFKLEPLLNHRQRIEDSARRDLAIAIRQRMNCEEELRSMQQSISNDKHQMTDSLIGMVDVNRIRTHAAHVGQVTMRAQQIATQMVALHRKTDYARQKLIDAMKQRKAIELLRKKQLARWQKEMDRRENNQLDEMAVQGFVRKRRETAA